MSEKQRRLAKTITWRIVAILITFLFAVIFLDPIESLALTAIIHATKTVAYYIHEWIWERKRVGANG